MPKFKGRVTTRGAWDLDKMKEATDNVLSMKMSVREAAEKFGVPKSSIHANVIKVRRGESIDFRPKLGRYENTFSDELEDELCKPWTTC